MLYSVFLTARSLAFLSLMDARRLHTDHKNILLYILQIYYRTQIVQTDWRYNCLKTNAQRKSELNWTDWCSVKLSSVFCCALGLGQLYRQCDRTICFPLRWSATIRRRNWRLSQVLHDRGTLLWIAQSMQCLSLDENRRRAATTGDGRHWPTPVLYCQEPATAVAGGRSSSPTAKNWTELNWTVFRCALGFSHNGATRCPAKLRETQRICAMLHTNVNQIMWIWLFWCVDSVVFVFCTKLG